MRSSPRLHSRLRLRTRRGAEARRSVEVEVELELGPRLGLERRGDVGAVPVEGRVDVEAQALDALGPRLPGGPGREKGAKFPTSKAPLSAVFRSFRLIFGRAIIPRSGLEAWMLFPERARAEKITSKRRGITPFPPRRRREHDGRRRHGHGHQFEQLGRRRLGVDGEGRVVAVLEVADGRGDERLGRLAHRVAEREPRLEAGPLRGHVQRLGREGRVGEVVGAAEGHLAREEVPVLVHDGVQAQGQPAGARLHGHLGLAGGRARHGKHERGGEALHRALLLVRASWVATAARSIFQLRASGGASRQVPLGVNMCNMQKATLQCTGILAFRSVPSIHDANF